MKKILFVNPMNYSSAYFANMGFRWPYLGSYQLARLTPEDIEVEIVDEVAREFDPSALSSPPDLVALSINFTASATKGYKIADALRKQGIKVIIGGNHATYCAEEAKRHADSVVMGEADEIWETVLEDARKGNLQPLYQAPRLPELSRLEFKRKRNPLLDAPSMDFNYIAHKLGSKQGTSGDTIDRTAVLQAVSQAGNASGMVGKALEAIQGVFFKKFIDGTFDSLLKAKTLGSIPRKALHKAIQKWFPSEMLKRKDLILELSSIPLGGYPIKKAIQIGRGCPVDCEFCSVTAFNGKRYRHYKIDQLLADISDLVGPGRGMDRFIFFADDNIVADPKFAKELFRLIKPLKISWGGQSTIQIARDPELLELAADSGCIAIFYGLETLKQETLKTVDKGFKVKDYIDVINATHDAGIAVFPAAFVFGLPGDTQEDIGRTVEFCIEQKVDIPQFSILTPLPGTRLWKRLYGDRLPPESVWEGFTYQSVVDPNLFNNSLGPEEVQKLWVEAIRKVCSEELIIKRLGSARYRASFFFLGSYFLNFYYDLAFNKSNYWQRFVASNDGEGVGRWAF